ncbi:glycosyltransferase family 20-domain-containing protein [Spinellus fusiger]|nr:glycosyltransferase family 20-domain-containing protein [Spinellus fusiger]
MYISDQEIKPNGIDTCQLKALLPTQGDGIKGKIISVVHQIPFECLLEDRNNTSETTAHKSKCSRINKSSSSQRNGIDKRLSVIENEETEEAPISHIARRRSTLHSLGETGMWRLYQRRGHSAMYSGLESLKKDSRTLYIGGTGAILSEHRDHMNAEDVTEEQKDSLRDLLSSKHAIVPIFIEHALALSHYEGYCKQVLWPLLHYMMWQEAVDESKHWNDYVAVNQIYANTVAEHYEPGDIIWVHDYHLLLVPQMIRTLIPQAQIGVFVHTPFPSSEIFRCLPRRRDILMGMLGADLIGFQTYNYSRHFSSNCTRILGFEYTPSGVDANGTLVTLGIYPIGIDVEGTRYNCGRPGVRPKMEAIRRKYSGKKIIVGRDKLDPVKGVLQKLEAFEKFLTDYPEWRDKVVLIQVTSPGVIESTRLENKVAELVSRINMKFGSLESTPVNLFQQHIDRDEYYALLSVADIALVTPVTDGMNTISFEYIVAQKERNSPLILSEFTGTASSMSAAVIVNPWDFAGVAKAISDCLTMSEEDRLVKYKQLESFVNSHTAMYWARSLANGLLAAGNQYPGHGPTPVLDSSRLQLDYIVSKKRLLFFDYDGTLTPICDDPKDAIPSEKMLTTLSQLCQDPSNSVWVISGRTQQDLDRWIGFIPNLGLGSEHGSFIKNPDSKTWIHRVDDVDLSWKEDVMEIFKYYTERTPGSFIEEKKCALTWHYRKADPKYGAFQAKECQNHLEQSILGKLPVETLVGKKNIEVRPLAVNKGEVIKHALIKEPTASFVLCVGDDKTDEDMFRIIQKSDLGMMQDQVQFTVMIGPPEKNTLAAWHLNTSEDLIQVLGTLGTPQA